ncbi:hypothetical protein [Paenibacillus senegalimassiliensis]|uniref:hypothetical protein n=1 Tax=Paenibacillus senegalimassiliensis TaxID=1737426 RepID=UPI00073EFDC7|nr:hypothetical protein [Paenibacillus senegalimassiliensis]
MDIFNSLLSKIGISGGIITLVLTIFRLRPVTMLTSTYVEKRLSTKERNLSIKVVTNIGYIVVLYISYILVFLYAYSNKIHQFKLISYLGMVFIFIIFLLVGITSFSSDWSKKVWNNMNFCWKMISLIVFMINIICIAVVMPFYSGSAAALIPEENLVIDTYGKLTFILLLMLASCVFSWWILRWEFKMIISISDQKKLFIIEGNIKWYIYHPVDNNLILIGNHLSSEKATIFRHIERSKLIQQNLYLSNTYDSDIEYVI